MQPVEKPNIGLRAVRRTALLPQLSWQVGTAAAADEDFAAAREALTQVLGAVAPDLANTAEPAEIGSGYNVALTATHMPLDFVDALRLRRLRSFAPATRARDRDVDVLLISAPELTPGVRATAESLVRRLGREHLLAAASNPATAGIGSVRDLAEVLGALTSGRERFDVLLMNESESQLAAAVIGGLTGAPEFATSSLLAGDAASVTAGANHADALPALAGLLLALSEMLVLAGRTRAATSLADAWCRTIEDGIRTADFDVTHPYARIVDDHDFALAVTERLGQQPRTVARHFSGLSTPGADLAARPVMRLVPTG